MTPEKLLAAYVIAGAVFFVLSAWGFGELAEDVITHEASIGGIDRGVANWLHVHATPQMTRAMLLVSYLGEPAVSIVVGAACAIALWLRGHRDAFLAIVLAVPCGMLLNVAMKHLIQRARPTFAEPLVTLASYSFPSGHALGSTVLYGVLAAIVVWTVKDLRWRVLAVGTASVLILMVCFSRIYLGVHYLSDVVAGVVGGLLWLALCLVAVTMSGRRRMQRDDE